jgi:hypothetical protein
MSPKMVVDQPIGEAADGRQDGLGFHDYARALADAAMSTKGPFTIGVFGDWGTGKTSLMRLMRKELNSRESVVTVWFNAWRYEREEHPLVPLVGTIVRELEQRAKQDSGLSATIRSVTKALRSIAYGFSATARLKMPGFAEVEASFVARDMIDRDEALTPDPLLDRSLYYGAFAALDDAKLEGMRIVILIDDLDRCFPDKAIELLESIKLVLAQPGFIFALGVSQKVLEGYLAYKYQTVYGLDGSHSASYLDKIVQLPYLIPAATERMDEFCTSLMKDQDEKTKENLRLVLPQVGQAIGGNPRAILRFFNNLLVDEALSEASGARIPIQFFAITRCLMQYGWSDRLAEIEDSDELVESVIKWSEDDGSFKAAAAMDSGPFVKFANELISDLKLRQLLFGKEGRLWLEDSALRPASIKFLRGQRRLSENDVISSTRGYDVFLSQLTQDKDVTVELTAAFTEKFGLQVFSSTTFDPGDERVQRITSGLTGSRVICVLAGERTSQQANVLDELDAALNANSTIRIIPVLVGNATPDDLPPRLRPFQWVDLTQGDRENTIAELARFIRRLR